MDWEVNYFRNNVGHIPSHAWGLRHFIWDIGKGFEVKTVDQLAAITLLGGVLLTLIYWLVFFII